MFRFTYAALTRPAKMSTIVAMQDVNSYRGEDPDAGDPGGGDGHNVRDDRISDGGENEIATSSQAPGNWRVVQVKTRVDSFNQEELTEEIKRLRSVGVIQIALNLRQNRFLNFPSIRFCVEVAEELRLISGGFALVGCSEKTKRHFEIYGSLDAIRLVRSETDVEPTASTDALKTPEAFT